MLMADLCNLGDFFCSFGESYRNRKSIYVDGRPVWVAMAVENLILDADGILS